MVPRYLYRGDKEGNLTMPEKYWSGLYTKLLRSGNPAYISKNGIIRATKSHISPTNVEEETFYNKSHFDLPPQKWTVNQIIIFVFSKSTGDILPIDE